MDDKRCRPGGLQRPRPNPVTAEQLLQYLNVGWPFTLSRTVCQRTGGGKTVASSVENISLDAAAGTDVVTDTGVAGTAEAINFISSGVGGQRQISVLGVKFTGLENVQAVGNTGGAGDEDTVAFTGTNAIDRLQINLADGEDEWLWVIARQEGEASLALEDPRHRDPAGTPMESNTGVHTTRQSEKAPSLPMRGPPQSTCSPACRSGRASPGLIRNQSTPSSPLRMS